MNEWFSNGRVVDVILVALALECALLVLLTRLGKRRQLDWAGWLPNVVAGGALLVALRFALADASWTWIAAALGLALLGHVADLRQRLVAAG